MDFFKSYATDPKLEIEGVPSDFGGGVNLLIARMHNPRYTRMMTAQLETYKHTLEARDSDEQIKASDERSDKIMADVMSKSVILGWDGPVEYDGQPLPYNVENAAKLLAMKDFRAEVVRRSNDFKNYRFKVEEADTKNSSPISNGTSPGVAV